MSVYKISTSCEEAITRDGGYNDREGFKCCGYCGSMEPIELAKLIEAGKVTMSGSDWKYGWPHKFYVDVENPHPEKQVIISSCSHKDEDGEVKETVEYGSQGAILHMKFYSNHLALLDNETFEKVTPIINKACGIEWFKQDGKLMYRAPYFNYQKS
jgi:hypothetical protein